MSPDLDVVPVRTGRDRRDFVEFPYTLYKDHAHWVPPLRRDEYRRLSASHNPFFEHGEIALWLARAKGVVVGRIAAIDDRLHCLGYPTLVLDGQGRAWRLSGNLALLHRQIIGAVIEAGDHDCQGVIGSTLTAIAVPVLGSSSRFVRWHFAYRPKETP